MRTRTLFPALALLLLASALPAGDDMRAVSALWNDFTAAVRRGDYRAAHALFSAESRRALPYAAFVLEYGPLSAARELVLAKPESQSARVDEDWAEVSYAGVNAVTGRGFRVGVAMVKNQGVWGLVAARNEAPERLEAAARGILRTAALWRGEPDAAARLDEFLAQNAGKHPALDHYRFQLDGGVLKATPATAGLRAFHVDVWGEVRPGLTPSSVAAVETVRVAPPPAPVPAAEPAASGGMPELLEPPPSPMPDLPGDMAEPPPPDFLELDELPPPPPPPAPPADMPEPNAMTLPDFIR